MNTAAEQLIAVWVDWETQPRSPVTVTRKLDVLRALGLNTCHAHELIADARRRHYSIPDAVQTVINAYPHFKEVS